MLINLMWDSESRRLGKQNLYHIDIVFEWPAAQETGVE